MLDLGLLLATEGALRLGPSWTPLSRISGGTFVH